MKRFYYTERKDCKNKLDRTIRVYALKNGELVYIAETVHRPGHGSRGATSEAFQARLAAGAKKKKYRGDGYFYGNGTSVCDKYDIREIY